MTDDNQQNESTHCSENQENNTFKKRTASKSLTNYGAAPFTDQVLLANVLRTGYKGMTALELSSQLLRWFGSLDNLIHTDPQRFLKIKSLGRAKISQLQAIKELCRRVNTQNIVKGQLINSPKAVQNQLQQHFKGMKREVFACLFLDTQHRFLDLKSLFYGTIDSAAIYPREIAKLALELNAAAVILAHNHPSGDPEPSHSDIQITQTIKEALTLLDIRVLDHVVMGADQMVSLAQRGLI